MPAVLPGPIADEHRSPFLRLHAELFPHASYSGDQLLEQASTRKATVLGLVSHGELAGYAAGRIDESDAGYIEFVAVAPAFRRQGHGRTLVAALGRALRTDGPISQLRLTVSGENAAALALYDALGFRRASSAVGYRRRPESVV